MSDNDDVPVELAGELFDCGCSRNKVELGCCDLYAPDGKERGRVRYSVRGDVDNLLAHAEASVETELRLLTADLKWLKRDRPVDYAETRERWDRVAQSLAFVQGWCGLRDIELGFDGC